MSAVWLMIREALTSKKFLMAIAGAISAAILRLGFELPAETIMLIIGPIVTYILAQGWADKGKEAAKVVGTVTLVTAQTGEPPQAVKDKLV